MEYLLNNITNIVSIISAIIMMFLTYSIAKSNTKSAQCAKEQLIESQKVYQENTRAKLIVTFNYVDNQKIYFAFKNISPSIAKDVEIYLNNENINIISKNLKEKINKLNKSVFLIEPHGEYRLYLNPMTIKDFYNTIWDFKIFYKSNTDTKDLQENIVIDISNYDWQFTITDKQEEIFSELSQNTRIFLTNLFNIFKENNKKLKSLYDIPIKKLSKNIDNIDYYIEDILKELENKNLIESNYELSGINQDICSFTFTNEMFEII